MRRFYSAFKDIDIKDENSVLVGRNLLCHLGVLTEKILKKFFFQKFKTQVDQNELKTKLTRLQYSVTQMHGTERLYLTSFLLDRPLSHDGKLKHLLVFIHVARLMAYVTCL
jgi:hypothetical protein